MTEREEPAPTQPNVSGTASEDGNREWQLAELVDAIAAEIDHAEDTLSLKSYARGMSFAIKQLSLDLEVTARRDENGRVLFRTVDADQTGATVLKLDFAQVIQSQLQGLRKPLDRPADTRVLATLPGITTEQIAALNAIAIFSVGDLVSYTQTAAMIAEVSRKTGIEDVQIREWRRLPFFAEAKPASGPPGSTVLIEGGNFGSLRDSNAVVLFQGESATITGWSESRLIVTMPQAPGAGVLFAVIGGETTNTIAWEATAVDLLVRDIAVSPPDPVEGDTVTVAADLINQGGGASGAFQVQWTVDGEPQPAQPHGTLQPGQQSMESSIRRQLQLGTGLHTIRFTADPDGQLPDLNRANGTLSKQVEVGALQQLAIGDFRDLDALDPLLSDNLGPADVLSLIFRGLCRLDPGSGIPFLDIADEIEIGGLPIASMSARILATPDTRRVIDDDGPGGPPGGPDTATVAFKLRDDVRFHDGSSLTAADVAFTYRRILENALSPWHRRVTEHISSVTDVDDMVLAFSLRGTFEELPPQLLTIGIVPRRLYDTAPDGFSRKPVGSGPFQIEEFIPRKTIGLRAFREYALGTPRLDRIKIAIVRDVERLTEMVFGHEVSAAVLPYSEQLRTKLGDGGEWKLLPLTDSQPPLLHVQDAHMLERAPNAWDTNWNAHLWYFE